MSQHAPKHKTIQRYHEPGDLHELTFSCYRRLPLLSNNAWRESLSRSIDGEHVHLLVWPQSHEAATDKLLAGIKRPVSAQAHKDLRRCGGTLLSRLTVQERPGKTAFRFWQEGPGYDRNLQTTAAVQASIDYIHNNPVKRGLCHQARDWRWLSARVYEAGRPSNNAALPNITFLRVSFWDADATKLM
jgi:putative transposase